MRRAGRSTIAVQSSASFAPCSAGVCALSEKSAKTANWVRESCSARCYGGADCACLSIVVLPFANLSSDPELFAVQEDITNRIAVALDLELVDTAAARPLERPDTQDYIAITRAISSGAPAGPSAPSVPALRFRSSGRARYRAKDEVSCTD